MNASKIRDYVTYLPLTTWPLFILAVLVLAACQPNSEPAAKESAQSASASTSKVKVAELSDAELDNLVRRSYQYVAMFNVNNKMALDKTNPLSSGGYNKVKANTSLADHSVEAIARPNNDTLYTVAKSSSPTLIRMGNRRIQAPTEGQMRLPSRRPIRARGPRKTRTWK